MTGQRLFLFIAGFFLLFSAPDLALGQKLQTGTWTGTAMSPEGEVFAVTYNVRMSGDTTKISVDAGTEGVYDFYDVKVLEDRITFYFTPGPTIHCTLMLQEDRSYKGDCIDDVGGAGMLHMIPPKKE